MTQQSILGRVYNEVKQRPLSAGEQYGRKIGGPSLIGGAKSQILITTK